MLHENMGNNQKLLLQFIAKKNYIATYKVARAVHNEMTHRRTEVKSYSLQGFESADRSFPF